MFGIEGRDRLFVITAFGIQIALIVFFALRKWDYERAMKLGVYVYAMAIPATVVSLILIRDRRPWYLWAAGLLYAAWGVFGYVVDIARPVDWRSPILWPVFIPYVALYLAGMMFYWWPLATIDRRLWLAYAPLFIASTALNAISHPR